MSVEDVAAATRIRATLVRSIEDDDFTHCGGAAYARGHIKSIAAVVGADGPGLVAGYDKRFGDPTPKLNAAPLPTFSPPPETRRPTARWASVAVAVLAVAAVFFGLSWLLGRGQAGPKLTAEPTPTASRSSAAPPTTAPATSTPAPTTAKPTPNGVTLRIRASAGDSWLLVTASSGSPVYSGVLSNGQQMEFKDGHSLTVKFGNSRAVTLTLNGADVGVPRCQSTVCTVQFLPPKATAG